jgi:uncharacterized protein with ParB-like and HNH nuclease domain
MDGSLDTARGETTLFRDNHHTKTDKTETAQQLGGYGGESEEQVNLLIDGQQRLTSLTLLVKAIAECLEQIAPQTEHEEEILDDVDEMEAFLGENNIYRLKLLDEKDSEYLERIIDARTLPAPERPSQRKMIEAKAYFDECLVESREESTADPLHVSEYAQTTLGHDPCSGGDGLCGGC